MIKNKDRRNWFGASSSHLIMGNWETQTFEKWWLNKIGFQNESNFENEYTKAGTHWEHRIISHYSSHVARKHMPLDECLKNENLRLRVNLDATLDGCPFEVKTMKYEEDLIFKMPKQYIQQLYTQIFITNAKKGYIAVYFLKEDDYYNYLNDIDPKRLIVIEYLRDEERLFELYKRLTILSKCWHKGIIPKNKMLEDYCFEI